MLLLTASFNSFATVLYQTSFETTQGYSTNSELVGQNGWLGAGSGGNGILADVFIAKGQQGYVGITPPLPGDSSLYVYQPINKNVAHAEFSVLMSVFDSTNTNFDDFYWVVFNQQSDPLFTLDFDNYELKVYYWLEGATNRTWSGLYFTNAIEYPLSIDIDFASNRWSAVFNRALLATNQPITTARSSLNLGDIDAAWVVYDVNAPGDNLMVFDDYLVTATIPPPKLTLLGILNGAAALRVSGQPDAAFVVEASTNFVSWVPLKTNLTTGGYFDFVDNAGSALVRRFYRGRWIP